MRARRSGAAPRLRRGTRLAVALVEESRRLRILVLDASGILPWRIRHALGDRHEVIATGCLEQAERLARTRHPRAAVVSVPHSGLSFRSFQDSCRKAHPPLPVFYESCLPGGLAALGLRPDERGAKLLSKPAAQLELARELERLLADAVEPRAPDELVEVEPEQPAARPDGRAD